MSPATTPVPLPHPPARDAAASPDGTAVPVAGRRRWLVSSAIVGVLAVGVAAGFVAVRSMGHRGDAPSRPLAGPPDPITVGPDTAGTPTVSATPTGPTSPHASSTPSAPAPVRSTAAAPAPVRSTTSPLAAAPAAGSSKAHAPITSYVACATASAALFRVTFTVPFAWHHVFIDADADTATGYRVPEIRGGLGADFMVEDGTLYRSTGSGWGWTALGGSSPLLSRTDGTYRWRVPLDAVGAPDEPLRVVFNGSGTSPEAYTPVLPAGPC